MENNKNTFASIICLLIGMLFVNVHAIAQPKTKAPEWKVPASEAAKKSEIAMDDNAVKEGKATWSKMCKSCHGAKGLGDGPKAANLEVSCGDFSSTSFQNQTNGTLFYKITKGRDDMPSYAKKISDEERWQLVAYIRTLKKGGASAQNTVKETKETEKKPATPKTETVTVKKETAIKEVKKNPEVVMKKDTAAKTGNQIPLKEKTNENAEENTPLFNPSPEYIVLKKDLEMLRQSVDSLNFKIDLLLKQK
ncbi:MAG: c-type cytochrome [Bacteroidia bacterium]